MLTEEKKAELKAAYLKALQDGDKGYPEVAEDLNLTPEEEYEGVGYLFDELGLEPR